MTRYFVLSLFLVLILLLFTCSGYQYNTTSLYAETPIDEKSPAIQEEYLYPTPAPTLATTPGAIGFALKPNETEDDLAEDEPVVPEESDTPSSTPKPQVIISDLPDWYKSTVNGVKVPILMYHNLLEGSASGDGLNVSEEAFDNQMYQLKAYGYNTITFQELYEHYMNGSSLPENPVIITFDDGYESNYTIGYPILKKYGFNACVFIIVNAIGNNNYMNEPQIKEVASNGVIDIQSHSMSHSYDLPVMSENKINSELTESKKRLESITGSKVNVFCYPIGRYSQRLVDKLIEQEYIFSVTTKYGLASKKANPFLIPRIRVMGDDSGKKLKAKIETLTKRITEFVGIPEETNTPEPSSEPFVDPGTDPSASPEPDPSTDPDTSNDSEAGTPIDTDASTEPEPEAEPNSDVDDTVDSDGADELKQEQEPEPEKNPINDP